MSTKIKKTELVNAGKRKAVKMTLEKNGNEYEFIARRADVLDPIKFKGLLKYWTEKAIPEQEIEAGYTDEETEKRVKKLVGKEIEK